MTAFLSSLERKFVNNAARWLIKKCWWRFLNKSLSQMAKQNVPQTNDKSAFFDSSSINRFPFHSCASAKPTARHNNDKVDKSGDRKHNHTQKRIFSIWKTKLMKKKIVKVCPFVVLFYFPFIYFFSFVFFFLFFMLYQ